MTSKDVKAKAKCYHSPLQITTSFVSSLWLGWGFPTNTSGLLQKPLRGRAQWMVEARVVVDRLDRKNNLLAMFSSQRL